MSERRVVVDTNVIVSGLLSGGTPGKIIEAWMLGRFTPVISNELKRELNDVIHRPNIKHILGVKGPRNIRTALGALFNKALPVLPKAIDEIVFQDLDDHFLFELAVTAKANIIVTGDKGLLALKQIRGIEILNPAQFCRKLKIR